MNNLHLHLTLAYGKKKVDSSPPPISALYIKNKGRGVELEMVIYTEHLHFTFTYEPIETSGNGFLFFICLFLVVLVAQDRK